MEQWVLNILKDCAEQASIDFRTDYSGRGMFGSRCVGISGSRDQVASVLSEVVQQIIQEVFSEAIDADDEQSHNAAYDKNDQAQRAIDKLIGGQSQDSMGYDIIVYWPRVKWQEEQTS